jgi:membrane-associated phospholipid phosphatase
MVGRDGAGGRRAAPAPPGPAPLAPPWAPAAAAFAVLVTAVLGGLVWHSTRLPGLDAWVLHLLGAQSGERQFRLATELATGLRTVTVGGILATALVAWMALRRWNAVALAVLAPATTLAVDKLLKPLVARRAPASTVFHYPSGHVAVATALALSLVLILRPSMVRPRVKTLVGLSVALLVPLMAVARLVETAHLLTDVAGGVSTGVAVTLGAALLLDRDGRSVRGGFLKLHAQGLGEAGVQRADREHRQRDHGRGDPEAVEGGDEDAEQDQAADRAQDPGHAHPARDRGPDTGWEQLGGERADRRGEHRGREDGEEVPGDGGRR